MNYTLLGVKTFLFEVFQKKIRDSHDKESLLIHPLFERLIHEDLMKGVARGQVSQDPSFARFLKSVFS